MTRYLRAVASVVAMYSNAPTAPWLQGDILKGLAVVNARMVISKSLRMEDGEEIVTEGELGATLRSKYAAVVSNSCDIPQQNPGKRNLVVVSPLRSISPAERERIPDLRSLNISDEELMTHINLFYFEANPSAGNQDFLVDFSDLRSYKMDDLRGAEKVLELDDETRNHFRKKVSIHFGRTR